jgi:hypothetical protein
MTNEQNGNTDSNQTSSQQADPPFSPGYAAALAEGRPPTTRDLYDSFELLETSPRKRVTLDDEQSLQLRMFALIAGVSVEELVAGFINTGQLLFDIGVGDAEARFWWEKRPIEQRPAWARDGHQQEFYSILHTLKFNSAPEFSRSVSCQRGMSRAE